ncbi:MAG: PTS sugar transporter subunit IIA [Treponema sp.]|jgi:mannitol/fructose-specific phosphotransferase system IIA component (Ntr-type)|nr:PTS sugar transporter subunit IIA [Treponema sp.]
MTLVELIKPDLVFTKAADTTKEDLIGKMVEGVYNAGLELPVSRQSLLETIDTREQIGGTLLPSGLAIPHARIKGYEGFVFAVATPANPLYQAGQEIRLVALMVTSQSGGPWYLETLAALAKISRDEEYFTRLLAAQTPENFLSILKERNAPLAQQSH